MSLSHTSSSLSTHTIEDFLDEAPFDYVDPSLQERLFAASRKNDVAAVQEEILKGRNINSINHQGYTPLHVAVMNESFDVIKLLLKQPSLRKNKQCFTGCTALGLGCFYNRKIDGILELIAAGCNLDLSNCQNSYPFRLLFRNGYIKWKKKKIVIEVLIKNGADLNRPKILKEFIKRYDRTEECLEILHLFLYYNIDVNANGVETFTFALKRGHFHICDILWDYIADCTINSNELLIESLKHGYKFTELIEKGANFCKTNMFEISDALFATCTSRDANAVEKLNYLWTRFYSHANIHFLIKNINECLRRLLETRDAINKECVIRLFHLFFNFAFESQCDLHYFIGIIELHRLSKLLKFDNDEMIKMFYLFLMCSPKINYSQLLCLYKNCSKDLFETFLKVNVKIALGGSFSHQFNCILYPDLLPLDMEDEKVPSLLKLSRNVIRKQFQPDYKTMRKKDNIYFRYYNEVNKLIIPKRIKDILLLNV